ncbi:retrovirus-related Pol polyprotein from transposon TNT 1-94 [Trifolium pratense]|uniref:Retrovirus-related Pol polyprotein from transposon TNT 1-94 n=1 Tax=Trifolium pratense TaxID=57577 RepID=A0A2K3PNA2_TRIPR|nr:retrovirus-related Pol polyprotein from transposon TNT 1-94 [Trifolium pratense]
MAESSNFLQPSVPKFDGYYEHLSMLMENLIRSKELWPLIETGVMVAPPNAMAEQLRIANESKLQDLKVKNYLFQSIDRTILETMLVHDTTKDIWDAIKRRYQGSTKVKRAQLQTLRREFELLEMKEGESVDDFFSRTLTIANRMTAQVSIEEQALKISNGGRNSNRGRGRGRHNLEAIECYKCHKLGHYQSACPNWGDSVNCTEFDEEELLLMATTEQNQEIRDETWYLDSGCSNHMIGNKDWLFDFDASFKDSVKLDNDAKMAVMGKMFLVTAPVIIPMCLQASKQERTQLCHNRYGHLSVIGLKLQTKLKMVNGLPELGDMEEKCSDYLSGKQQRAAYQNKPNGELQKSFNLSIQTFVDQ